MLITEYLHLDMPWLLYVLLYDHLVILEAFKRLILGRTKHVLELSFIPDYSHSLASAAE